MRIFISVLDKVIDCLEFHLSPRQVVDFVTNYLSEINLENIKHDEVQRQLALAIMNVKKLEWEIPSQVDLLVEKLPKEIHERDFPDLNNHGWDKLVFSKGIMNAGGARFLETLYLEKDSGKHPFFQDQMEKLLRHIEVRKSGALTKFEPKLSEVERWNERLSVSIFFSRYARMEKDLRFINCALKMNDWYFPHYNSARGDPTKIKYILSLTEQELSLKESR
jgi:hypothetical protein